MDKLVSDGLLLKAEGDVYTISNRKSHLSNVKEEMEAQEIPLNDKVHEMKEEDYMYMKALYHALPMDYVTIPKLQTRLEGEANQATVRKMIDKMAQDGFLDSSKSSRRLGKRVIHSEVTAKKLLEVKKVLEDKPSAMEICELHIKSNCRDSVKTAGSNRNEMSTCCGFHSIGSDLTRTGGRADTNENGSVRNDKTTGKMREQSGNSPISRVEMQSIASRESGIPGKENDGRHGKISHYTEVDNIVCNRSTQDKQSRKASTVEEPILQYSKRLKTQVSCL